MPDTSDEATRLEEVYRENALARRAPSPQATGFCLNCGEPLPPGERWCDMDCRDDYIKYGSVR